jgi:hypothetical protein
MMRLRNTARNQTELRDTEFRILPRNFREFRIAYGMFGSKKKVRNSVNTLIRDLRSGKNDAGSKR